MGDPSFLLHVYIFVLGLCVGSFLNVVIYRLPNNQSIVSPGSHCPDCGAPVRARDNIPLLSWLFLFGLCRDCGVVIPFRYFFVELVTGLLTLAVVTRFGVTLSALFYLLLAWALIAVTFIDLNFQIIPDELTVGAAALGLAVSFLTPLGIKGALLGLGVGGGIFFALAIIYPGGMGGGDIKLMAAIGAFTGWKLALLTIFTSSLLGAVVGIMSMAFYGKSRKDRIPFGPFLSAGALISILWGDTMIAAYLNMIL
ncbi:MAG TPA: prepilin peptidase [Nitrospirae bacterium]|nr:prepilin peptidase [Nitrospirota bacterium]